MLLRLPRKIFDSLPAAALIGSLLSLGNLAVHRELIVMRASGISSAQLLGAVGLAGFGLAVVMALLGESLAPSLSAYAAEMRTRALHEEVDREAKGKRRGCATAIESSACGARRATSATAAACCCSSVGRDQLLKQIARADSADIDAENRWVLVELLRDVVPRQRRRHAQRARGDADLQHESRICSSPWCARTCSIRRRCSATSRYLKDNQLDSRRYEIAYWSRMSSVVSVVLMTVLALPFVFGGLRSAGTGARLLVGLVIGLSYYVIGEVLTRGGEVYDLDPLVVAWAPSALLLVATLSRSTARASACSARTRITRVPDSRSCQQRRSRSTQRPPVAQAGGQGGEPAREESRRSRAAS